MKKKLLPLAIAAAMAPGFAAADVSGYVDTIFTIADDQAAGVTTPSPTEGKFDTSGEIDFSATPMDGVTVRVDVDVAQTTDGETDSTTNLEQAFFAWAATDAVTVMGGVFNNPVGMESSDAPEMWGTNGGVISNILNGQTDLYSNNLTGLAVSGNVGPVTLTGGVLSDIQDADEENSLLLVANTSPIDGLDLELGFLTQADQATHTAQATGKTSIGDIIDFNASFAIPGVEGLSVGLDFLIGDVGVDSAYELMVDYMMGPWGVGARIESVSYEAAGVQDSERTTIHGSYEVAKNLVAILEVADGDEVNPAFGIQAESVTTLELIATF